MDAGGFIQCIVHRILGACGVLRTSIDIRHKSIYFQRFAHVLSTYCSHQRSRLDRLRPAGPLHQRGSFQNTRHAWAALSDHFTRAPISRLPRPSSHSGSISPSNTCRDVP